MTPITAWPGHQRLLRALYRELLRNLRKIRPLVPDVDMSKSKNQELAKASKNPHLYGEYLRAELKYRVDESFRRFHSRINGRSLYSSLLMGENLNTHLESVIEATENGYDRNSAQNGWNSIIEILIDHRNQDHERNRWKSAYILNKKEIDQGRDKNTDPLTVSRRNSSRKRSNESSDIKDLSLKEQRKAIKNATIGSSENSAFVVRNYLKKLQLEGRIPNPYKLPNVPASLSRQMVGMPRSDVLIPGSTKSVVLDAAYDSHYIESIIKPEVEFKINQIHHMGKLEKNIEDGPYKVKIRNSNAGVMTAHFLRLPFTRTNQMREMAVDIKKLMRAVRKQFIWNLQPSKGESAPERTFGLGYSVRDSGGYSSAEIMFPREYYENLVMEEARWEMLMEIEQLRALHGEEIMKETGVAERIQKRAKASLSAWKQPLIDATNAVNEEVQYYYTKYKIGKNSPIWKEQQYFQQMMDEKYDETVVRYAALVDKLEKDRVFPHSEIYRTSVVDCHEKDKKEVSKNSEQRSEVDRRGQGKHLGDYLEDHGFKAYMLGYKFKQRFGF